MARSTEVWGPGPGRACGTSRKKCPLNVLTFSGKWESGHQPGEDRGVVGGLRRWSKCDIMWKRGEATGWGNVARFLGCFGHPWI